MFTSTQECADTTPVSAPPRTYAGQAQVNTDLIAEIVDEIESMDEEEARKLVVSLVEQIEAAHFKLGGVIFKLLGSEGADRPDKEFLENVRAGALREEDADDLIDKYCLPDEARVPWDKLVGIPWSRFNRIADIVTRDNVDELMSLAKRECSFAEFVESTELYRAIRNAQETAKNAVLSTWREREKIGAAKG